MNEQSTENRQTLLNTLEALLQKQLLAIKNGNLRAAEKFTKQADEIANQLSSESIKSGPNIQWNRIERLYKDIGLCIQAQKDLTNKQLIKVQNGRLTLRAYQNRLN